MKNITSSVMIFGLIILILVGGAYLFQYFNGVDSIKNIDDKIVNDIGKALEGDNFSVNKPDNLSLEEDNSTDKTSSDDNIGNAISNFFEEGNMKNVVEGSIKRFSQLLSENGLSLDNIKENEHVKKFISSISLKDNIMADNKTMQNILDNKAVQDIFKSQNIELNPENVDKILNSGAVKEFLETGDQSFLDNITLNDLLDNENFKDILGGSFDNSSATK